MCVFGERFSSVPKDVYGTLLGNQSKKDINAISRKKLKIIVHTIVLGKHKICILTHIQ